MDTVIEAATRTNGSAGVIALVVGIIVVLGLIGAFVFGARRKQKEPPPPVNRMGNDPSAAPGAGSWSTPPSTPGESPQGHEAPPSAT